MKEYRDEVGIGEFGWGVGEGEGLRCAGARERAVDCMGTLAEEEEEGNG